jgi:radical SAM superfamily enzyme YgiQ (UPF0313 family)
MQQLNYVHKRLMPPVPPLGLCKIAAILEKNGFDVHIIDQYAYQLSNERLLRKIIDIEPQVVGFSCLTPSIDNVKILSRKIRLINKDIKIVLGNLHATIFSDEILRDGTADVIVRGEGEYTTLELLSSLRSSNDLSGVGGISYSCEGKIVHNPDREPTKDLHNLPFPAWHLIDLKYYRQAPMLALKECILPLQASRGCHFSCIFCAQEKINKGFRIRQIANVVDEMEYFHNKFKINSFGFCDSYFPSSAQMGFEFCEEIMSRGLAKRIKWTTEMRVDQAEEGLIKKMKQAGLHLVMFGFESGNQQMLDSMGKKATLEQAKNAMLAVKKAGILTLGLFIIGMPGETVNTCKDTIDFAKELDCDVVKFNIAIPYPGTRLYELYKDRINPKCNFEDFTSWQSWLSENKELPLVPDGMNAAELINMQQKGMFSYYMRPHFIFRHIQLCTLKIGDLIFGGVFLFYKFIKSELKKFNPLK